MSGPSGSNGGSAAIELVVGVGFLILPAVLLVLSLPGWAQAKGAAEVAAREAARAVVLAGDPASEDALLAGRQAAVTVLGNHGQEAVGPPAFSWGRVTAVTELGQVHQQQVEASVTVRVPALTVPFIGSWASFNLEATHTEAIDIYRSTS